MDNQDLTTLCTVNTAPEAELIRAALESDGIPCVIGGEGQAGLAGVLDIAILVQASDVDEARALLDDLRSERTESDPESEIEE